MKLRSELLRRTHDDGSLELYDPLMEQLTWIPASELDQWPLKHPVLAEGPLAERLRAAWWARRTAAAPPAPNPDAAKDGPWGLAEQLPERAVAARWRDPETWRRLAEDRRAGNGMLPLSGLVSPGFARALADAHDRLPFARLDRHITAASRCLLATTDLEPTHLVGAAAPDPSGVPDPILAWLDLLVGPVWRSLLGAVLGHHLPARLLTNAWRLEPGDHIAPHLDGRRYLATLSLGLERGWTAQDGGAITQLDVQETSFEVRNRWFPHLGDALVVVRGPMSWHHVEPPRRRRRSLTTWWMA